MKRFILLVLTLSLGACGGEGSPESEGRGSEEAPGESIRLPDSLRVVDSLSPLTPGSAGDSLPDGAYDPSTDSLAVAEGGEVGVEEDAEAGRGPRPSENFPRPDRVKGVYLNAWTSGSTRRREALITLARRTEVNAFVIDIKDATGFISHPTQLPLAHEVGATGEVRIRDLAGLLERLREAGVYPIARIVVAKDPILTAGRPDLAIQDSAGGVWLDQDSVSWLNFYDKRVWDYHVALAKEVVRAGFPEVQWDYVRFPDAPEALRARSVFPGSDGRTRVEAVRGFLAYSREVLGAEGALVTADVFGVTTSYRRDVGIGQVWESFIDQVDVALPMVYPSHYWTGSFGYEKPNAFPYEIVRRAMRDAVSRSAQVEGAGMVRPWLQDFTLGDPPYGAPEIRAQIQAAYDAGVEEWILWNPGSRYTESALMPAGGLPSWLEPVMRVGGEVVPISKRYEVLGEVGPEEGELPEDTIPDPEILLPAGGGGVGARALPPVPLPDTGGMAPPDTGSVAGSRR
jgi:hypothetical protein